MNERSSNSESSESVDRPTSASPGPSAAPSGTICPNCGRRVDAGFRFCDGCGSRLSAPAAVSPPPTQSVQQPPLPAGVTAPPRSQRIPPPSMSVPSEPVPIPTTPMGPSRTPLSERLKPLLDRLPRRRRPVALDVSLFDPGPTDVPRRLQAPEVVDIPMVETTSPKAPPAATGAVSRPTPADRLRGVRPAISGWLRRSSTKPRPPVDPAPFVDQDKPTPWRTVPITSKFEEQAGTQPRAPFFVQLGIAFLSGLVFVLVITGVASLVSDGGVAVLEAGGLPIFIGGAASVVSFSLLRTSASRQAEPTAPRTTTLLSVVGGLVALVVAAGLMYQPAVAKRVQPRIERALGVFGNEDAQAVKGIQEDVTAWNDASKDYQQVLQTTLREGVDFDQLRNAAGEAEAKLEELVAQMRTHAQQAQHAELRDALDDLTSVYDDQLGGLRVVNRGLLLDTFDLIETGNSRFQDAQTRARSLFDDRLRALLERGGYDADAFGQALAGE